MTRNRTVRWEWMVGGLCAAALLTGCEARREVPPSPPPSDYAVYSAVLGADFMRPRGGEHGLACEDDAAEPPPGRVAIVDHTRPIGPLTPVRDSAWPAALPREAAPLFATLRALDSLPRRPLAADSFSVAARVELVADSLLATHDDTLVTAAPLHWFSRVAYSADRTRALLYGIKRCRNVPTGGDEEEEPGASGFAFLVPIEYRAGAWVPSEEPLYLVLD